MSVPVGTPMDDVLSPADEAGMERDRLTARIEELERQKEYVETRIQELRRWRSLVTSEVETEEGPREVVLGHLERLTDGDETPPGLPESELVDEAVAEGVPEPDARAALDTLKSQGEVYVVGDEVRRT